MKKNIFFFTLLVIATSSAYGIETEKNLTYQSKNQSKQSHQLSFEDEGNKMYDLKLPKKIRNNFKKLPSPIKTTIGLIGMTVWVAGYFMMLEYMFPLK